MKIKIKINKTNLIKDYKNFVLLGIIAILAIVNVVMTINTSATGVEIASLQDQETSLVNQKRDLQDLLVASLSVNSLQEKSSELGFVKPESTIYLSDSVAVAKLP